MSGVKGKSGRKRKSLNREDAMRRLTQLLPRAIDTMEETVTGKNKDRLRYESAKDIKETVMGKPKQAIELEGGEKLGFNAVALFALLREEQKRLLKPIIEIEEVTDAIQGQGNTEGVQQGEDEEGSG